MAKKPSRSLPELSGVVWDVLKELKGDLAGAYEDADYQAWASDVAPRIAAYAILAAQGHERAAEDLRVLRATAIVKACRVVVKGDQAVADRFGEFVLIAARFVAAVLV